MRLSIRISVLLAFISLSYISCASEEAIPAGTPIKIAVCSDIHYLSDSLRDGEAAFKDFNESGDGKLLHYGTQMLEAFTADMSAQSVDVLIVSGDLTVNGEKASHKDLASYFSIIEKNGTRVLVIPGNHDINNPYALGFKDGERYFTDSVSEDEFSRIYKRFGYKDADLRDPNSLSYLTKVSGDLWVLMLDSNKYENNYKFGAPFASGELRDETLDWLEKVADEKKKAGLPIRIISVTHHNLIPHSSMFSDGFTLDNYRKAVPALKSLGIQINLSGHLHIQDIAYHYDSEIYDTATGSLSVYPQKYGLITVNSEELEYTTKWIDVENWARESGSDDPNLLDFRNYSDRNFRELSEGKFAGRIDDGYNSEEAALLIATMSSLNSSYFAGSSIDKDEIQSSEGFKLWENADDSFARTYLMTMIEDRGEDNKLYLKLR